MNNNFNEKAMKKINQTSTTEDFQDKKPPVIYGAKA